MDRRNDRKGKAMMPNGTWAADVKVGTRALTVAGLAAIGVFALAFGAWAAYAPLSGAAVATGHVAVAGRNQRIQHLEGGIVDRILVREGDTVGAGQILFELDPTAAQSLRNRLRAQLTFLNGRATRLRAERDGRLALDFAPALLELGRSTGNETVLEEQVQEFEIRLERHRQEGVILRQRVISLNDQIDGRKAQETAVVQQLEVVREETERKRLLLEKGLTDRSEYTLLLRSEADLVGQLGQARSSILSARTQIVEAEEQYSRLTTQRIETAASELNDVRAEIANSEEQLGEADSVLARIKVRSPSAGIVVSMAYNTPGSVVKPGDVMLELLPTSDALEVEAQIAPADIDIVHVGQKATLRFSALNARTTPMVEATVTYVSADRLVNPDDRQPFYTARLRITDALPPEITTADIYPGMPVETYIKTADRTFFEYLGKPLTDSFSRAFREE